ncbi:SapC family protein [Paraglaciecola sp. 2405UD69-4]|uniref:SapC family protein n=1 Tax=Paraglaciecola sp. 2405UD69-4 TaxID=3391836 RepID=UPI0039C97075
MSQYVAIDETVHGQLKVNPPKDFTVAKEQNLIPVVVTEFANAATSYPIVLLYDKGLKRYRSVVLTSIFTGENLYYRPQQWEAIYIPKVILNYPFAIGLHPSENDKLTVHIDVKSELVNNNIGLPLFEMGAESQYFKNVQERLGNLYHAELLTGEFLVQLSQDKLITPMQINLAFTNGDKKKIVDMFTIDQQKLSELPSDKIAEYQQRGYLAPLYSLATSSLQLNRLRRLFNEKHDIGIEAMEVKSGDELDSGSVTPNAPSTNS